EDRVFAPSREERDANRHPGDGAVERESTSPDRERLQWVRHVFRAPVDEDVSQARAEKHPEYEIPDQVVEIRAGDARPTSLYAPQHETIPEHVSDDIHQAVPPDRYRTKRHDRRRDARIWYYHGGVIYPPRTRSI